MLTYERRRFFEWGGWLAVRPMRELPHYRTVMHRERDGPHWTAFAAEHATAIAEMREVLRTGREVANRDFAMHERQRVDHYRGRKDSALALHYLWRIGEAMVTRRERFERVYARTERVAPRSLIRESDDATADDALLRKEVAFDGLTRFAGRQRPPAADRHPGGARGLARPPARGRLAPGGPRGGLDGAALGTRGGRGDPEDARARAGPAGVAAARDDHRARKPSSSRRSIR